MAETITIPKPRVPHGPLHMTEDQATAMYLREMVDRVDRDALKAGSNVTATVRKLLLDVAFVLNAPKPAATTGATS